MKTENPWLDGMWQHSSSLREIAFQISDLGRAFSRTGNESVASELLELAQAIRAEADKAKELTGTKVNGDYREAVEGSATVLRAMLAGAKMAKSETEGVEMG